MANPSREKGTRYEVACAEWFRQRGWSEVFRMATRSTLDVGDLGGLPRFAVECRDRQKQSLSLNVDDAEERARNKNADFGVALMKRPRRPVGDSYVCMSLTTFGRILDELLVEEKRAQSPSEESSVRR